MALINLVVTTYHNKKGVWNAVGGFSRMLRVEWGRIIGMEWG